MEWSTPAEAVKVMLHPPHLRRTIVTAILVGTVLFVINHLDNVLAGRATAATYWKGLMTYIVPLVVTNWGLLVGTRR